MNLSFVKTAAAKRATFAVLVLALVAGVVTGREKPSVPAAQPVERIATRVDAGSDIDLAALERPVAAAPQGDPFAPRSFAPHAQTASAEPTRPVAPPLPFRYMGRLTENGKTEVFVLRDDDIISISPGRKIDAHYRVDAITDRTIRMTYLPLKTRQTLEIAP